MSFAPFYYRGYIPLINIYMNAFFISVSFLFKAMGVGTLAMIPPNKRVSPIFACFVFFLALERVN